MAVQLFSQSYFVGIQPKPSDQKAPTHRNALETISTLKLITGANLAKELEVVNHTSSTSMMRMGRTDINTQRFENQATLFDLSLMEGGAITPRHLDIMACIDPNMYRRTNISDLYDQFSVTKWAGDTNGSIQQLAFLGEFFSVDPSIKHELQKWDQSKVLLIENGGKVALNLTESQIKESAETKKAYEFLLRVLKLKSPHSQSPSGAPSPPHKPDNPDQILQKQKDELKVKAQETIQKYGVSETMIESKIAAIEFEMGQILATSSTIPGNKPITVANKKDAFFKTTEGYRYQRLQEQLNQVNDILTPIKSSREQSLNAIDSFKSDQLSDEITAKFIADLETKSQAEFQLLYEPIAEELVASLGNLNDMDDEKNAKQKLESQFNDSASGVTVQGLFRNRAKKWDMDAATMHRPDREKRPIMAYLLWGRYAGMSQEQVNQVWKKNKPLKVL